MAMTNCEECGATISTKATSCVQCGAPISDRIKDKGKYLDNNQEKVIAEYRYSMLNSSPLWLLIFIATSFIGVGIVFLVLWTMFTTPRPRLTITDRSLIYRDTLLVKNVINFNNIESITVGGSPFQKLIRAGSLIIRKKGFWNVPLIINGLPDPQDIKILILKYKT